MSRINVLDNFIDLISVNDNCTDIYNKIVTYGVNNIFKNEIKLDNKIDFLDKYKNKINYRIYNNALEISSIDVIDNTLYELSLNLNFLKIKCVFERLVGYLIRKKVKFKMMIDGNKRVNNLIIIVDNTDNVLKITDYINSRLSNVFYKLGLFSINDDKVAISLCREYSYYEVLSMYIKMFREKYANNC